jgi:hypothetical protein
MSETIKAKYKATIPGKSSIEIDHGELPLEIDKLIVWVMTRPEEAMALLPEYERLRGDL